MKIEYRVQFSGLTCIKYLKCGQFFLHGGPSKTPDLYMMLDKGTSMVYDFTDQKTMLWEEPGRCVAVVNVRLVVEGYAHPSVK
jgi:hypothetical protein